MRLRANWSACSLHLAATRWMPRAGRCSRMRRISQRVGTVARNPRAVLPAARPDDQKFLELALAAPTPLTRTQLLELAPPHQRSRSWAGRLPGHQRGCGVGDSVRRSERQAVDFFRHGSGTRLQHIRMASLREQLKKSAS